MHSNCFVKILSFDSKLFYSLCFLFVSEQKSSNNNLKDSTVHSICFSLYVILIFLSQLLLVFKSVFSLNAVSWSLIAICCSAVVCSWITAFMMKIWIFVISYTALKDIMKKWMNRQVCLFLIVFNFFSLFFFLFWFHFCCVLWSFCMSFRAKENYLVMKSSQSSYKTITDWLKIEKDV